MDRRLRQAASLAGDRKSEYNAVGSSRKRKAEEDAMVEESEFNMESLSDSCNEKSKPRKVQKPDYVHVRARPGQATASHSLAERVRREIINKKMKYLQDLVPGCDKVNGKAAMLDEIINYVQSLQRQIEFLSMKLAVYTPMPDFSLESILGSEFPPDVEHFQTARGSSIDQHHSLTQLGDTNRGILMSIDLAPSEREDLNANSFIFQQVEEQSSWATDQRDLSNASFH